MEPCTRCGSPLREDEPFTYAMRLRGIGRRRFACLNAHSVYEPPPPRLQPRPVPTPRPPRVLGRAATRTACPQGHAYTPANTYLDTRGCRRCRACNRKPARRAAKARAAVTA